MKSRSDIGHAAPELDEIVRVGVALFGPRVCGRRYAVRCKRVGSHAFGSMDVERALGAALNEGATVELSDPWVMVAVEVDHVGAPSSACGCLVPAGCRSGLGGASPGVAVRRL